MDGVKFVPEEPKVVVEEVATGYLLKGKVFGGRRQLIDTDFANALYAHMRRAHED